MVFFSTPVMRSMLRMLLPSSKRVRIIKDLSSRQIHIAEQSFSVALGISVCTGYSGSVGRPCGLCRTFLASIWQLWQVIMSLDSFCDLAHNASCLETRYASNRVRFSTGLVGCYKQPTRLSIWKQICCCQTTVSILTIESESKYKMLLDKRILAGVILSVKWGLQITQTYQTPSNKGDQPERTHHEHHSDKGNPRH